jgi:hypothetical protein
VLLNDSAVVDLDAHSPEIEANGYDYEVDSDLESEPDSDCDNLSDAETQISVGDVVQDSRSTAMAPNTNAPLSNDLPDSPVITPSLTGTSTSTEGFCHIVISRYGCPSYVHYPTSTNLIMA